MSIVVRMHHTGRRRFQEAAALSLRKDQPGAAPEVHGAEGIFIAPFETGEIALTCSAMPASSGWRLVWKHRERAYRGGRCAHC